MPDVTDLIRFLQASPSPDHAVAETARRLEAAGWRRLDPRSDWGALAAGDRLLVARGGTLVAALVGERPPAASGFRILGAHTDSPGLRLKPRAETAARGWVRWGVEVYGGAILATWADRDLGLAGRVAVRGPDGPELRLVRVDRPVARIPTLAIHLDRKVNDEGLVLHRQHHLPPVVALGEAAEGPSRLEALVAAEAGCEPGDLLGWDLGLHDLAPPAVGGVDGAFVLSARLDDLFCCHAALSALLALDGPAEATALLALFDHEEVGSTSDRGAASAFLGRVLGRLARAAGTADDLDRALASSRMVSCDMAHALHPAHADRSEPEHAPLPNAGPVLKTNASLRYASDALSSAWFREACRRADVPLQEFVNRTDLACGSTIGPLAAAGLGIPVVDVGCAMLSMHSVREQAGAHDTPLLVAALAAFLRA